MSVDAKVERPLIRKTSAVFNDIETFRLFKQSGKLNDKWASYPRPETLGGMVYCQLNSEGLIIMHMVYSKDGKLIEHLSMQYNPDRTLKKTTDLLIKH